MKISPPPRWETAILACSFVLIWLWWLAHMAAQRAGIPIAGGWQAALGGAVILLVLVMVRRILRVREAIRELKTGVHPGARGRPEDN